MTKRIFFGRYDSAGKFEDGRIKLDIYFKDSEGNGYVWTPDWERGTRNFFLEAYRVEKLNRPKGLQVRKFRQTGREVSFEEEIESYNEFNGEINRLEQGKVIIGSYGKNEFGHIEQVLEERTIPLSVEFRAKIMGETRSLLNWIKRYKGHWGKWIIVNGELFDVEWKE